MITDKTGEVIKISGTTQDITGRKRIEDEILMEKNLLDSIINGLPGSFYLYTKEGEFLRWNRNFEKVTLYGPADIRQMYPLDFFDADEREYIRSRIDNVFENGTGDAEANMYTRDKRKIPYYFTGIAIEYKGRSCLMGVGIDISEKVEAQKKIRQTTEQLRQLAAHLEEVREEERASIAREVHDELGQQLTGLKMDIYWLKDELKSPNEEINRQIEAILSLVDGTINMVRKIAASLRPVLLDDLGLVEAMRWHGIEFQKRSGIGIEFNSELANINIHPKIAIGLFRIFQESLTNVARHAEASGVVCRLDLEQDNVVMEITDNGKGFDVPGTAEKRTLGLLGMKERISMMEGKCMITSRVGIGTAIMVTVPFSDKIKDKKSAP
jgi:PAS domain S-box-containing protein